MSSVIAISSRVVNDTTASFDEFIETVSGWNAFSSLWISWAVTWLLRLYFSYSTDDDKDKDNKDGNEASTSKRFRIRKQFKIIHKNFTQLLLGLLSVLTFNSLANNSSTAVEILSWIYLGFGLFWVYSLAWASRRGHIIYRFFGLFGGVVQTGILLAIFILALIHRDAISNK
ncbi:8348_t:CDS:2 [Paraglomus occultum]|uniref:8348_t:CDS:1 n=1 Tax=Paraglomus occultum TaxID=144539 RepID=A0A9N9D2Q9_9GLOM|nr:8348_t:CDS:2 [Paraglomus occultum]